VEAGCVFYIIGAYLGISFDAIYLNGTPQDINDEVFQPRRKHLARFLLMILLFYLPQYGVNKWYRYTNIDNDYNRYAIISLLSIQIPSLIYTFIMFSYSKLLFKKLKLNENIIIN
jgi:hypothetical protein